MLITLSGLDGSGKTTLITFMKQRLEEQNHTVKVLTMYDDVAFYALIRSWRNVIRTKIENWRRRHAYREANPAGVEAKNPGKRTGVSISRFLYRVARHSASRRCVLPIDLLIFVCRSFYERTLRGRILIMDRYFYDSLADVATEGRLPWVYIRLFMHLLPKPEIPILVDVCPEVAFARKPEYPLEYLTWRRGAYRKVFTWVHRPIVLDNRDLASTVAALKSAVAERLGAGGHGI